MGRVRAVVISPGGERSLLAEFAQPYVVHVIRRLGRLDQPRLGRVHVEGEHLRSTTAGVADTRRRRGRPAISATISA